MLLTNYDYKVLENFYVSEPKSIINDDPDEIIRWTKYFKFLKSGTDLVLTNFHENKLSNFINVLTSGRGNSKFIVNPANKGFYNNTVPKDRNINETFFIDDKDEKSQKSYITKNAHFFGFITNHFEAFERLAILKNKTVMPVRKNKELNEFKSWDVLKDYLLPFSDCIIVDNYLFAEHKNILDQNLSKMLIQLDKSTPVKYNLLIITYRGNKGEIKISDVSEYLNKIKRDNNLKANISVIVTSKIEHDRNIFMNYIRIKSGSGFNCFDSNGFPMVNTEIEFQSYTEPELFTNASIIIKNLSKSVLEILKRNDSSEVYGDCKNRLLDE